jgi:hypothetical protein
MKSLTVLILAVSALVSASAFADAGDRVDQVFPQTPSVVSAPASTPVAESDSNLPASFVNVYFGGQ